MSARRSFIPVLVLASVIGLAEPVLGQAELRRALARLGPVFGEAELHAREGKEEIPEIAQRYGVSASAIHNANLGDLLAGDELLLIPGEHIAAVPWAEGVVVNLTERNLYFYEKGRPVRCYPTAIGMRGWETPTGEYTIANKRKNPTWFPPRWALEEEPVPPGPANPLGDRWMGLSKRGYGIHATNAPSSVGRYVSHGCMRMYPEHAHELYELVEVGTPVRIIYRRVVFGFRPEEGAVYMAYYPDPYRLGEVKPGGVRRQLRQYGLDQVADMAAVAGALERPGGVPTRVIGSGAKVMVNGERVELALGPTRVGGDWLVPAGPLVKALGAELELGPRRDYWLVRRAEQRIFFSSGHAGALVNGELVGLEAAPQLAAGYPLVPVKGTVGALGGSVGWDEVRDTILVWDGWGWAGLAGGREAAGGSR